MVQGWWQRRNTTESKGPFSLRQGRMAATPSGFEAPLRKLNPREELMSSLGFSLLRSHPN